MPNMDEKEKADRLAAAEALFMIFNRGEEPQQSVKTRPARRDKKQKLVDYDDITAIKKRAEEPVNEGAKALPNGRGRGRRGGGSSSRGRGKGRGKKQTNVVRKKDLSPEQPEEKADDVDARSSANARLEPSPSPDPAEHEPKKTKGGRGKKRGGKTSAKSHPKTNKVPKLEDGASGSKSEPADTQAIGFTGAGISRQGSTSSKQDNSESADSQQAQNLPSLGLVSGLKQVTLAGKGASGAASTNLPSLNLSSFTEGDLPSLNLPSLPVELPFLQLSSKPTPNLSSLGDAAVSASMEVDPQMDRDNSEKFLPLKKRKLHKADGSASTSTAVSNESPGDALSDSEDQYEDLAPEPARPPFTVQAPPIITMQTLMEIKTALQADDDGDLPLHIAVVHENMRMVAKLVSLMRIAGKKVDKFNKQQQTPLHLAIKLDFTEAVELLLRFGADVNAVDCSGSSAIHMAVQGRSTPILRLLLEKCPNAQLNNRNIDGLTPLHLAVDNGDLEQVELLLKHGADIDVTDGKSGRTPLFRAAESNHKPMVEMLLKRGANVEVCSYAGVTVSMAAQGRNLHGVLKLLGSVPDKYSNNWEAVSGKPKPSPLLYIGVSAPSKSPSLPTTLVRGGPLGMSGQPLIVSPAPPSSPSPSSPHQGAATSTTTSKQGDGKTYLIRPQIRVVRGDNYSGGVMLERSEGSVVSEETKVFKNVFTMSEDHDKEGKARFKSTSEPSSPEVKMEVDSEAQAWKRDLHGGGLLSLPNSLLPRASSPKRAGHPSVPTSTHKISTLSASAETTGDKSGVRPGGLVRQLSVGSPNPPGSPHTPGLALGQFVGRMTSSGVLHLFPSSSSTTPASGTPPSSSAASPISVLALRPSSSPSLSSTSPRAMSPALTSSPQVTQTFSHSMPSSPASSSPRKSSSPLPAGYSSTGSVSSPSRVVSGVSPPSGDKNNPGSTLGMAALTSTQAKLYYTLLRRANSQSSGQANSTPTLPPSLATTASVSCSADLRLHTSPASLSSLLPSPSSLVGSGVPSSGLDPGLSSRRQVSVPVIRIPALHQGVIPASSPPSTPLNLSKPSSERRHQASKEQADPQLLSNASTTSPEQHPVEDRSIGKGPSQVLGSPAKKAISTGLRRLSNGDAKPVAPATTAHGTMPDFQGQYKMFLVPGKQADMPGTAAVALHQQGKVANPAAGKTGVGEGAHPQHQPLSSTSPPSLSASSLPPQPPSSSVLSGSGHTASTGQVGPVDPVTSTPVAEGSAPIKLGQGHSIMLDQATVAAMSRGDLIVPNFPHISKCVSPATALIVRDLLSRQNQLLQKPPSSSSSSSASSSTTTLTSTLLQPAPLLTTSTVVARPTPVTLSTVQQHQQQPAGRIIIPPALTQNSIVGLSGAILSVVPTAAVSGKQPDPSPAPHHKDEKAVTYHHHHQQGLTNSPSQRDYAHAPRRPKGSRGGNKGHHRVGHNSDTGTVSSFSTAASGGEVVPNANKINSETDQKLKRFLSAKRQESPMLAETRAEGPQDPGELKKDAAEEGGQFNPVGIFSGNVQQVRLAKTRLLSATSPSPGTPQTAVSTTALVSSFPATLSSHPSPSSPARSSSPSQAPPLLATTEAPIPSVSQAVTTLAVTASSTVKTSQPHAVTVGTTGDNSAVNYDGGSGGDDDDDDDDEEKPMEIDCSVPVSESENVDFVRVAPSVVAGIEGVDMIRATTIPGSSTSDLATSSATAGLCLVPPVQIVVQSPTPPLPVEIHNPGNRTQHPLHVTSQAANLKRSSPDRGGTDQSS